MLNNRTSTPPDRRYSDYDRWAWLYNQTMGAEYCQNQKLPLDRLLLSRLSPQARLLDLCCGTGHLMQYAIEQGYSVTGLDGSEAMLHYAAQNAPAAELTLADVRSFELPSAFDGVFSTSASLNHLMSLGELQQVFSNVYAVLRSNGWFLFDLNHPGQMQKWWTGTVAEGEISRRHAWMITSAYSPQEQIGNFQVTIFEAQTAASTDLQACKQFLYRLLSLRLLTRLRLKLLTNFSKWQPDWQRSDLVYQVRGYWIPEVETALKAVGFTNIQALTIAGKSPVDDNHSAYFLCQKLCQKQ